MNGKKHAKHKRRVTKLNPKLDRGSQHRKTKVGKSNIAAKRVTLLPGFLINGFTSDTAKKTKSGGNKDKKTNDDLLTENLQAFLGQKTNLRRSQRISRKYNDDEIATVSSKSSTNDQIMQLATTSNALSNVCPSTQSFKSILKKNAKSIFKEISDKFSKVHIQNKCEKPNPKATCANHDLRDFSLIQSNDTPQLEIITVPSQNCEFPLFYNRHFCEDFTKKIRVSLKKNTIEDCLENIKKEINTTNLILEGKIRREETVSYEDEDNDSEEQGSNSVSVFPIPSRNWVYRTPMNQKINVPQLEECQLKPALLCASNNRHDLYEINPKHNLKFSDLTHVEDFSENSKFFKKITAIKRTPATLGPRVVIMEQSNPHKNQVGCQVSWSEHQGRVTGLGKYNQQLPFELPSATILSDPVNAMIPVRPCYQENKIPTNIGNGDPANNFYENPVHDFTFIEDGNDFKVHESQSTQRTKRRLSEENDYVLKRVNFGFEPGKCDKPKMFDFTSSQERNMFDFGVIM